MREKGIGHLAVLIAIGAILFVGIAAYFFAITRQPTWKIAEGSQTPLRAVHMTGKWASTKDFLDKGEYPKEYFEFLRDMNVNWVGISVALNLEDSMDATVKRKFRGLETPSFTDNELRIIINKLHGHGFKVYLTLAYQDEESKNALKPVRRWQIGDPNAYLEDSKIKKENWPWTPEHPQHEVFIKSFWESYTNRAVEVGRLAQELSIEMYSLGTETDRLFRTRAGGDWPNDFGKELKEMVSQVRQVYKGKLTYDQHASALMYDYFHPGSKYLFEDLDLDVVGISGYFPLTTQEPTEVMGVTQLEKAWQQIFDKYLTPLKQISPNKVIYFTEVGYIDLVSAPLAEIDFVEGKMFEDHNGNGLDDGEETQSNIYQALFNTIDRNRGVLDGAFLWEVQMTTREYWNQTVGGNRNLHFLDKLAEDVVRQTYKRWRDVK